jgi:hypothetical protein
MPYTEAESKIPMGLFKKGHKLNNGRTPWNKGKSCPQLAHDNSPYWKGEKAGYTSIHAWVRKYKGKPSYCEKCGKAKTTFASIQWANIDHQYRRVLDDYIALCVKCHREYDREHNS